MLRRRTFGPVRLAVFRDRRDRWRLQVELPASARDEAEASALAEAVAQSWLTAHAAADSTRQRSA